MNFQADFSGIQTQTILTKAEPENNKVRLHKMIGEFPSGHLRKTVSAQSLMIFFCGLFLGFILGTLLPGYLPGMSERGKSGDRVVSNLNPGPYGEAENKNNSKDNDKAVKTLNSKGMIYNIEAELARIPLDSEEEFISWTLKNTGEEEENILARWQLSRDFIESGELQGDENIAAFLRTPREKFVREANVSRAYEDTWLPIGYGATITDPDVVAMMTTALAVKPDHKVLEIGTGSGYQSAILSNLSNHIYTIEIIQPLYNQTDMLYKKLESDYPSYKHIVRKLGDGFYGWEKFAPFDRIIVTCSIDHLPPPLIRQLSADGIMIVPLGPPGRQFIMEMKKIINESGDVVLKRRDVYNGLSVKFIPFRNESGDSYSRSE